MTQLIVVAKEPVPGRVKTRLCPPCTPAEAARIAAGALADTLAAAEATPVARRVLLLDGRYDRPGWHVVPQRGDGLGARLAHGLADVAGQPALLIGMDTPQVNASLLTAAVTLLETHDAVLGHATDGGWWALGLADPAHGAFLADVPMSTDRTGALTLGGLLGRSLRVALLPTLRDVDTFADALAVAALAPGGAFARAVGA